MDQPAAQDARRGAPAPALPAPRAPAPPALQHYDMTRDKIMLIFNNREFQQNKFHREPPEPLLGNDFDAERLTSVFESFGFRVEEHVNKTADEIFDIVNILSQKNHRNTSCVCVAVLSHGGCGGSLHAADHKYCLRELVERLQFGHEGLVGKPKLFLVQACRGERLDPGRVELDGSADAALGSHADTLVLTASVEGFVSWGQRRGSWLVQELCRVLEHRHRDLDLLQVTTLVTSLVTRGHASSTLDPDTAGMRQTPETRSTLTKLLRLSLVDGPADR